MKWDFRPSALTLSNYATQARDLLESLYNADNAKATRRKVSIPPKPEQGATLRTLQWNIQAFAIDDYRRAYQHASEVIETILHADADVIILNEYHWCDEDSRHARLEKALQDRGYTCTCASVFAPTFVATRWRHKDPVREVKLSMERSALMVKVQDPEREGTVWVIGTHLDFADGKQRKKEMETLLNNLPGEDQECAKDSSLSQLRERMIIMGDLNQQRQQDYSPNEWDRIAASMDHRGACHDDGVAGLLHDADFTCAWDGGRRVLTNWSTEFPPSTHWSGTVVDYAYSRNLSARGVYISSAGASDHRMTVADWEIE